MNEVVIWAVVDAAGEVCGAYTNRLSAWKRADYLDGWAKHDSPQKGMAPFTVIRCVGAAVPTKETDR